MTIEKDAAAWWQDLEVDVTFSSPKDRETLSPNDYRPQKERAKKELGQLFVALPKEYQDIVRARVKSIHMHGLHNIGGEAVGGVYNLMAGGLGEEFTATLRHDYKYRPHGIHTDNRYFSFERVVRDTNELTYPFNGDGMRLDEQISLQILGPERDEMVDEVQVRMGSIVDNENASLISLSINDRDQATLFVHGFDFDTTIAQIRKNFPELGAIEKPARPHYKGDTTRASSWKISLPYDQAVAFRNAVREQILVAAPETA